MDGNNNSMTSSSLSMKQMVGIMGGKGNPHPLYKEREMVEVCRSPDDEQNLRYRSRNLYEV